jgi:hypothetical protein
MTDEPDTDTRLSPEDAVRRLTHIEGELWLLLRDIRRKTTVSTRWSSIAWTHFQEGGMALRRALDNPWEQTP